MSWITYKAERNETYKQTGFKSLIKLLKAKVLIYGENNAINLINESMANNWQGIIWDRLSKINTNKVKKTSADELHEMIARGEFNDI